MIHRTWKIEKNSNILCIFASIQYWRGNRELKFRKLAMSIKLPFFFFFPLKIESKTLKKNKSLFWNVWCVGHPSLDFLPHFSPGLSVLFLSSMPVNRYVCYFLHLVRPSLRRSSSRAVPCAHMKMSSFAKRISALIFWTLAMFAGWFPQNFGKSKVSMLRTRIKSTTHVDHYIVKGAGKKVREPSPTV